MPSRASQATRAIGAAFAAVLAFLAVPESAGAQTDAQALPTVRPSIAIEPQNYPDAPNQPSFPTTVLKPNEKFHQVTTFTFGVTK